MNQDQKAILLEALAQIAALEERATKLVEGYVDTSTHDEELTKVLTLLKEHADVTAAAVDHMIGAKNVLRKVDLPRPKLLSESKKRST